MDERAIAIGVAKATAYNQHFLNTCDAVISWIESHDGQYFLFEFNPEVEVPYVPRNVWFQRDQSPFAEHVPNSVTKSCKAI
jgi:hypothetical protein